MNPNPRWAVLGTAGIARDMIRGIRAAGGEVRAVASRDIAKARAFATRHSIPLAFGAYDELLRSGEADIIYIPLPNSLHAEWTIRALETGHAVLCEKPLCVNASEAREVARVAERTGRVVAEGFMYRFHPQWERVLEILASGEIGDILSLSSRFTFRLDDPSANPASKALAGGALMDVGCYCVNFARLVTGNEPVRASAFATGESVDETMTGLLEFPSGILAYFEASIASFERYGAEIAGSRGAIVIESPWIPGESPARLRVLREDAPPREIVVPAADSFALEAGHFMRVVRGECALRWPVTDAIANMVALDALHAAAESGAAVRVAALTAASQSVSDVL